MPTATSFTALGKGNGFPECLKKCDVSEYDLWVTLGGFKQSDGGSPTKTQINSSLINAMKLLWNSYSFSYTATGDSGATASFANDDDNEFREPFKTVCHNNVIGNGLIDTATDASSFLEASVVFSSSAEIQKFYNGDITNENNFIGYGIKASGSSSYNPVFTGRAAKTTGSPDETGFIQEEYFSFVDDGASFNSSYVEISGIPFVLQESSGGTPGSSTIGNLSFTFYTY